MNATKRRAKTKRREEWEIYEEVAGTLLKMLSDSLGLELVDVETKQDRHGRSRTTWEIDRVGVAKDGQKVVTIECRRLKDRLKQNDIAALAYIMRDVGAASGIVVTASSSYLRILVVQ
jgi:hypothetical protein